MAESEAKPKERRRKGDGGIYFNPKTGNYEGSVEFPANAITGKRRRKKVYSKSESECISKKRALEQQVVKGEDLASERVDVKAWLEYWVEAVVKPRVKPKTLESYRGAVHLHLIPEIGKVKLGKLMPEHVRRMNASLIKKSPTGNPRIAQLSHAVLSKALNDAMRDGKVSRNVAALEPRPKRAPNTRTALTIPQVMKLMDHSRESGDPLESRWWAAFMTGARRGELLGLEWDRVHLDRGIINLSWQLQSLTRSHGCGEKKSSDGTWPCGRKRGSACPKKVWDIPADFEMRHLRDSLVLTRPKSAAGTRIVPINARLKQALQDHHDSTFWKENPFDLVWTDAREGLEGHPLSPRQDWQNWKDILKSAGLPDVPLHSTRHTTATIMRKAGVDVHTISKTIGHSDILVTDGYIHDNTDMATDAMNRLGDMFNLPSAGLSALPQ